MAETQKVMTIVGRIGRVDEETITPTGKSLTKFSVAVSGWDREAREETTTWYECSAWEKDSSIVQDNVKVGQLVYVTGRHSVYSGTSGDKQQLNINEIGSAERFRYEEGAEW